VSPIFETPPRKKPTKLSQIPMVAMQIDKWSIRISNGCCWKMNLFFYKGLTYHGTYLQELPLWSSECSNQIQKYGTKRNVRTKKEDSTIITWTLIKVQVEKNSYAKKDSVTTFKGWYSKLMEGYVLVKWPSKL
jgi:hypothetical protein